MQKTRTPNTKRAITDRKMRMSNEHWWSESFAMNEHWALMIRKFCNGWALCIGDGHWGCLSHKFCARVCRRLRSLFYHWILVILVTGMFIVDKSCFLVDKSEYIASFDQNHASWNESLAMGEQWLCLTKVFEYSSGYVWQKFLNIKDDVWSWSPIRTFFAM